jgi:hypothetical protein
VRREVAPDELPVVDAERLVEYLNDGDELRFDDDASVSS